MKFELLRQQEEHLRKMFAQRAELGIRSRYQGGMRVACRL